MEQWESFDARLLPAGELRDAVYFATSDAYDNFSCMVNANGPGCSVKIATTVITAIGLLTCQTLCYAGSD